MEQAKREEGAHPPGVLQIADGVIATDTETAKEMPDWARRLQWSGAGSSFVVSR